LLGDREIDAIPAPDDAAPLRIALLVEDDAVVKAITKPILLKRHVKVPGAAKTQQLLQKLSILLGSIGVNACPGRATAPNFSLYYCKNPLDIRE
jgi:hypothetical protein